MSLMYSQYASEYDQVVQSNIYNALFERPSTQAMLDNLCDKRVLDLGCGSGVYAEWILAQTPEKLTCIDASSEMVGLVKTKFPAQVCAYVQDLSLGLPDEPSDSFDVIVCPLVLHYIADLSALFADVQRVLKPGGYMVFSTHHPFADFECSTSGNYFLRESVEEQWDTVGVPLTVKFYRRSLSELCQAVTDAGLKIAQISEGQVDPKAKDICPETYLYLTHKPNFIFIRCEKLAQ